MLIETITGPFAKALSVNHQALPFDVVNPFGTEPLLTSASQSSGDGVPNLKSGGAYVCNKILMVPYAEGMPGGQFSVRVWALRRLGGDSAVDAQAWINTLLGEYLCTVCNQPGPPPANAGAASLRFLLPTENLCDTITLTHGSLGLDGVIVSPGSDVTPGPDLTAWILQNVFGSERLYFDFQPENGFTGTMNLAWARA